MVASRERWTSQAGAAEEDRRSHPQVLQDSKLPAVIGPGPGVAVFSGPAAQRGRPRGGAHQWQRSVGAGGRADGQGVGERRDAGAEQHPGGRERRGQPVVGADAVVAVFAGYGEARAVDVHRGARGRARSQAEAASRARRGGDMGGDGGIGVVQSGFRHPPGWCVRAVGGDPHREAPDAVPAVAAVHGREVDWRARAAMAAGVDVFRADAARARVEESAISIHTPAVRGMGGVGRGSGEECGGKT